MDKREYRELKRTLKKEGNRIARKKLKQDLREHPDLAHMDDIDYGGCDTKKMTKYSRGKDEYRSI
jgi:hypothetical protein